MDKAILDQIYSIYEDIKNIIREKIKKFKNIWENATNEEIFLEMAFCLFTPQSKARHADIAIKNIISNNLLYCKDENLIANQLNMVRFKNNKARYFLLARDKFLNNIRKIINPEDIFMTREYLVKNVKGYGYKEASHFLRNIGFVEDIAILDRHIIKNLVKFQITKEFPQTLNKKKYYEIEKKIKEFSQDIKIPLEYLDFILWYKETKDIFK